MIFEAGWVGTQRVWYLRIFRGRTLDREEIWPMTAAFVGRYIVLGLLVSIPFSLLFLPIGLAVQGRTARALAFLPFVFVVDFVGTFVTPALAFSTRSAVEAIGIGWRTLWGGWPATAPYAVVAPLVVIGLGQALQRTVGGGVTITVALLGTMLSLLFKGATAAYFQRHHRVSDSGAT
jgi:hypothetical protein